MPKAGLSPEGITEAGAKLADELGLSQLSMMNLAERLGVKAPSLYKHVGGLADLSHRIAIIATVEVGELLGRAIEGRSGKDALSCAAHALRAFVRQCPGRYSAMNEARPTGPADPLEPARERALGSLAAALRGYRLHPADEVHALRMIRSSLHGFATLESSGGFQLGTDVDTSFSRMIDFIDRGLRLSSAQSG